MAKLDRVWCRHSIRLTTYYNLYESFVVPILFYGCETLTLLAEFRNSRTRDILLTAERYNMT